MQVKERSREGWCRITERGVQFVVKMRVNEHRETAVRRHEKQLTAALAHMAGEITHRILSTGMNMYSGLTCHAALKCASDLFFISRSCPVDRLWCRSMHRA
jgi:hypothetical protein